MSIRHQFGKRDLAARLGAFQRLVPVVAVLAAAALQGACGEENGATVEAGGTARLTIGTSPAADNAPMHLADRKGYYEEQDLEVDFSVAEGGAAIVPAVIEGSTDIGASNITSLVIARSKGLPIKIISVVGAVGEEPETDTSAVMVPEGAPIREPRDLEGKTISVNTLNNIGPLSVNAALEAEDVDFRSVEYTEVPFPEAIPTLEDGQVDAAWVVEPFVTAGRRSGARTILRPFTQTAPGLPINALFVTESFLERNRDVVRRLVRAVDKGLEYSQSHPGEMREVITSFTEIPEDIAAKLTLPTWEPGIDTEGIQRHIDLAARYGFIDEKPELSDLLAQDVASTEGG